MNAHQIFSKRYDLDHYNCAHFVRDVWFEITGQDISENMTGFLTPARSATIATRKKFKRLERPKSPCVIVMVSKHETRHVGVFFEGKVLHLNELGVENTDVFVATRGFEKVRYYEPI